VSASEDQQSYARSPVHHPSPDSVKR